ncbi:hypothetical protein [Nonomuraea angiospora]|uniref:hypothetical protein n=1 Tax=Nonomuraea angiospora TaxID=46172 RepID=UPI0029BC2EDE|nr:hypothetical protein [Nonomuraea angiospora]MDX3106277.1 hypothetical protein [Nonomuraea angiospora]
MADDSNPYSSALNGLNGLGGATVDPRTKDPDFAMKYSSVNTLGKNVGSYGDDLTSMSQKTGAIDMHQFTFGVIGGGLNVAHRSVRDGAVEALKQAKEVLDSWKQALADAATNGKDAEEASKAGKGPGGPGGPGPLGGGGLPKGPGLGGLPKSSVNPDDLKIDKPSTDIPKPDIPGSDIPKPDIPGSDIPKPDIPGSNIDPPKIDQPNIDQPKIDQPNLDQPDIKQPDVKTPDLSALNQTPKTNLEGLNPSLPTTTTPQVPSTPGYDPRASVPRTSVGVPETGVGYTAGGGTPGTSTGAPGSIARALNSGMPLYPMSPGMGGGAGQEEKDRERGPHLGEDEAVWETDEDITPAVLGREE